MRTAGHGVSHLQLGNRESTQEVRPSCKTSKPAPVTHSKPGGSTSPTHPPPKKSKLGPSVHTHEPVEDSSHSNHDDQRRSGRHRMLEEQEAGAKNARILVLQRKAEYHFLTSTSIPLGMSVSDCCNKTLGASDLKKERYVLAHSLRTLAITAGKSWLQEPEAAGHIASWTRFLASPRKASHCKDPKYWSLTIKKRSSCQVVC